MTNKARGGEIMENELISPQTEENLIDDLEKLIESKKPGKILLIDYINSGRDMACMDFAMLYESSPALRYFIKEQQQKGVIIQIEEDSIFVR